MRQGSREIQADGVQEVQEEGANKPTPYPIAQSSRQPRGPPSSGAEKVRVGKMEPVAKPSDDYVPPERAEPLIQSVPSPETPAAAAPGSLPAGSRVPEPRRADATRILGDRGTRFRNSLTKQAATIVRRINTARQSSHPSASSSGHMGPSPLGQPQTFGQPQFFSMATPPNTDTIMEPVQEEGYIPYPSDGLISHMAQALGNLPEGSAMPFLTYETLRHIRNTPPALARAPPSQVLDTLRSMFVERPDRVNVDCPVLHHVPIATEQPAPREPSQSSWKSARETETPCKARVLEQRREPETQTLVAVGRCGATDLSLQP
jgi:hypothetical protein